MQWIKDKDNKEKKGWKIDVHCRMIWFFWLPHICAPGNISVLVILRSASLLKFRKAIAFYVAASDVAIFDTFSEWSYESYDICVNRNNVWREKLEL